MTRKGRHFAGSHLEAAVEGRKPAYTVHFTFYKAVRHRRRQSRDRNRRYVTSGDLEVAVEGRKLSYTVHFTSYKAVAGRRRHSRGRK